MIIGEKIKFLDENNNVKDAVIEAIIPPGINPKDSPDKCNLDRKKFNIEHIGGEARDIESYLINASGKDYKYVSPMERYLIWPEVNRIIIDQDKTISESTFEVKIGKRSRKKYSQKNNRGK